MNKKIVGIFIMMLLIGTVIPVVNSSYQVTNERYNYDCEYVLGEFIVKFSNNNIENHNELLEINQKYGISSFYKLFNDCDNTILDNIYIFYVDKKADILSIVKEFSSLPYVEYAIPNSIIKEKISIQKSTPKAIDTMILSNSNIFPNDPDFNKQWSLHNTGQTGGNADADIDAPEAWDIETGDDIIIAIPDSGIDLNHPDLDEIIWINDNEIPDNSIDDDENGYTDDITGWDFAYSDNEPDDMVGHGTLIAGLIGAEANNNEGIAGICWNCKIMPLKIHNSQFSRTRSNTALAIKYAADNGADIISMSIGRYTNDILEEEAAQYAYEKGCIQVCAAGNDNIYKLEDYPLSYDCVIGVAGTNEKDERCDEDDWGSPYGSNYGEVIDVAAPANDIYSTMPTYQVLFNEESWFSLDMNYDYLDGNSLAAPHVAGIAALLLSTSPDLTYEEIRNIISTNVDPYDSEYYIGTGRVNAYKALMGINRNPDISTIDGPASGAAGKEHEYIFEAIDPDGDDVSYCIDWGDNSSEVCIGPFPSGTEQTSSHIWAEEGTYIIRAKTKDIHGAESDWATFEVSMPKSKAINTPLFLQRFFHRFPLFEIMLNQIIL